MTACETKLLGSLDETLQELKNQIRNQPSDVKLRIFLFQLLSVMGDWQRATRQLEVCGQMDDANLAMMHTYRALLQCEALRHDVFDGQRQPLILGEPQPWIALLLEAIRLEAAGEHSSARKLREQAYEQAEPTCGQLQLADGSTESFAWIADADSRMAPVLEAVVEGKYYWIPWTALQSVDVEPPHDLRDLVWCPAYLTLTNGGQSAGFVPSRYAGSENQSDDLRLSRKTEWIETSGGAYHGLGQRMLATDQGEYALLDVRRMTFDTQVVSPDAEQHDDTVTDRGAEGLHG